VSLHQEVHNDLFGASLNIPDATVANPTGAGTAASSKDTGTRLSGEFRFLGSQRIVADVAFLEYKESGQVGAGRFAKYEKVNWGIGWDGGFGPWRVAVQYLMADKGDCERTGGAICSTEGLEATMITAGVRYRFDRQTFVYFIAALLENDPSARMDNWANGSPNRGADPQQFAIGISYSF
jgi:predicted porin